MNTAYKIDEDPIVTVEDTVAEHVRILGHNLRGRDVEIAHRVGIEAHRALWRIYRRSLICRTVFVYGHIVAMFGVAGTFLGQKGKPWFVASPFVEDYPMKMVFRYRTELLNMLKYFPVLEDWVPVDDYKTIRLLEIIGFKFGEPEKYMNSNVMFIKATLEK